MPTLPLTKEKARIFRITHVDNLPWLLANGIQCRNNSQYDPNFVEIGNPELISKRTTRRIEVGQRGTLSDYVPFYFTSLSPMLYNIKTGRHVPQRPMNDIVIIVSSLPRLVEIGIPFVFTDRHAYLRSANFGTSLEELELIDWEILQNRDFKRDPENPEKMDKYQAEALIYKVLPVNAIAGLLCHSESRKSEIELLLKRLELNIKVAVRPDWFF